MERALLEGEQEAEAAQLQQEKETLDQLKDKMADMEKKAQDEKTQVNTLTRTAFSPWNFLRLLGYLDVRFAPPSMVACDLPNRPSFKIIYVP